MLNQFAAGGIEINVGAGTVFTVGGFPITNTMLTGAVSLVLLLATSFYVVSMIKRGRYNRFVGLAQWAFEGMLGQIDSVIPDKELARKVTPLALTIFFFMLFAYSMSVLPGLESVTYNHTPLLRSLAADLNFTFAVTIIVFFVVQFYSVRKLGPIGSLRRYIRNPIKDPIGAFEGALEFIGEFSRYMALSVRMFGNCFAGEILLMIISVLTSYFAVAALPFFMLFELFIGFIQAYVFFILTVIFTALAVEKHGDHPDQLTSTDHSPADRPKTAAVSPE